MLLTLIILMVVSSWSAGFVIGKSLTKSYPSVKLIDPTIPIAELISSFEEFARNIEGGELSTDANAAINILKNHAEQKYLKAPVRKPIAFNAQRDKPWSDINCFEGGIAQATTDDERIVIIHQWLKKYFFGQPWQTWCIKHMTSQENRNQLRTIFNSQDLYV